MISVRRYTDENKELWNDFNSKAKNYMFMFDRDYMDYHRDRFIDHSLLFFSDDDLVALFPACEKNCKQAGERPQRGSRCISGNFSAKPDGIYLYKKVRCHNRQIHKFKTLKGGIRKLNQSPYMITDQTV